MKDKNEKNAIKTKIDSQAVDAGRQAREQKQGWTRNIDFGGWFAAWYIALVTGSSTSGTKKGPPRKRGRGA
jgi:hypothetical protein